MPARSYVKITKELTYGAFDSSGTANEIALHIPTGNDGMLRRTNDMWELRSAGASNRKLLTGSERYMVGGKINTPLFGIQAKLLMSLIQGITSAGGGAPYDLPSFSYQYGIWTDDNQILITQRVLGCKFAKGSIKASSSSPVVMFDADIVGSQVVAVPTVVATNFPEPTFAAAGTSAPTPPASYYPVTDPFAFQDSAYSVSPAAGITINSVTQSMYDEFTLEFSNFLQANTFEAAYVQALYWRGRDVSFAIKKQYKNSTDRTNYEAVTALGSCAVVINDGTNKGTFTMNNQNFYASVKDDLPATTYTQTLTMENYLAPSAGGGAGADISYAQTP